MNYIWRCRYYNLCFQRDKKKWILFNRNIFDSALWQIRLPSSSKKYFHIFTMQHNHNFTNWIHLAFIFVSAERRLKTIMKFRMFEMTFFCRLSHWLLTIKSIKMLVQYAKSTREMRLECWTKMYLFGILIVCSILISTMLFVYSVFSSFS